MELTVNSNLDPAGLNSKVSGGKMLDQTDPKSVELIYVMLKGLSKQVWRPLKTMIKEALGASMAYPGAFLASSSEKAERLYVHAREADVTYTDVANLYTLLLLSIAFQRPQVLRDSTVHEFTLVPGGTHYKLTFKGRAFKSSAASALGESLPVSHFNHSPDPSMIIKFLASVGHRFCDNVDMHDEKRRLFLNSKGEGWTQGDIGSRFKKIWGALARYRRFLPPCVPFVLGKPCSQLGASDRRNCQRFQWFPAGIECHAAKQLHGFRSAFGGPQNRIFCFGRGGQLFLHGRTNRKRYQAEYEETGHQANGVCCSDSSLRAPAWWRE